MRTRVLLLALLCLLAACGDADDTVGTDGTDGDSPLGRTFLSTSLTEDGAERDLVPDTRIRLTFDDDTLDAEAGCNHLFGDLVSLDDGTLAVSPMGGTEMGCDAARHDQDAWLMEFLESSPSWTLDDATLTLTHDGTTLVLLDRVEADPDRPLEGTRWVVDTVFDGETAMSTPDGTEAFLVLSDGSMTGSTGCNTLFGRYLVDGDRLSFPEVGSSLVGCFENSELEQAMEDVLESESTVEIVAGRLTLLTDAGRGLGFHADEGGATGTDDG